MRRKLKNRLRPCKNSVFLSLMAFGLNITAHAESHLSGRLYTDQYLFTHGADSGTLQQSSVSGWLDWDAQNESGFGTRVIAQGDVLLKSISEPSRPEYRLRFREAYASYLGTGLGTGLEVRIGQQIIPWGKSDGVNPTDYFSAKDYTLLNPDDEVRRLGAIAASISYTPNGGESPVSFQVVAQGNYPQTRLLIPSSAIPAGVVFQREADTPGLLSTRSLEIGGKISILMPSFDFSVSAFSGFSHAPQYRVEPLAGGSAVRAYHAPQTSVGTDGSFNLDAYVFRFESALHMPANGTSADPLFGLVQPWHWDSVIGFERPIGSDFRAQMQFLYRWHPYFAAPVSSTGVPTLDALRTGVGQANALILNYQRRSNPGATFRLAYAPETSDFSADVFLIGYFSQGQDYLLRPQVSYTPVTNLKLSAGADWYGGNSNRPLGALRDRSDAFFETRWMF